MKATLLETAQQAADAGPGIYAVHSGSGAYFPVMAMLEAGHAFFRGEVYDDRGRLMTVEITTSPHPSVPTSSAQDLADAIEMTWHEHDKSAMAKERNVRETCARKASVSRRTEELTFASGGDALY